MIAHMFGPGAGWWPLWILVGGLFQVALVVGIVLLVASFVRRERRSPPSQPASLQILEERYARGEISREEFLERRAVLTGHHRPTPGTVSQPPQPPPPPAPTA